MLQENGIRFPSLQEDGDEVVIQAGCVRDFEGASSQDRLQEEGEARAEGGDAGQPASFQPTAADAVADAPSAASRERSGGMATTEQDLNEQVPFSGMRRVIMILAAVAIIAMVAYCLINR